MILCIKHSTAMRIKILGRVPGTATFEPLDEDETDDGLLAALGEEVPGVLIVRIRDVALTFANTGPMKERLRRLERYGHGRHHPAEEPRRAEASVAIFRSQRCERSRRVGARDPARDRRSLLASECPRTPRAGSSLPLLPLTVLALAQVFWTQCHQKVLARLREAGVIEKSGGGKARPCMAPVVRY